jgi:outer membrane protein assembly factor BamB
MNSFQKVLPLLLFAVNIYAQDTNKASEKVGPFLLPQYQLINSTFLGNFERNFYGNEAPDTLQVLWKHYLGKGKTVISRKLGEREWAGAGWTGQPLLVKEDSNLFIIQGAYDHNLKKIDAKDGKLIWQYKFDDVIKGTGTIWENPDTTVAENKLVILQGSRLGVGNYLDSKHIPSYRAVSYFTGKELWRLDIKWTKSYSRDVDGSALIHKDTAYLAFENSLFTKFNPDYQQARMKDNMLQPAIYKETKFYTDSDAVIHGGNLVSESSPCILDSIIYTASGTGHIFGYSLKEDTITWDFFIGSDIDGSAVVTHDSCLIVTIEKQYIKGNGGVMKLNPRKSPENAVVWFFPTKDVEFASWEGGVIGSATINDLSRTDSMPYMAAFTAIDGYLYVVNHLKIDSSAKVLGPNQKKKYYRPKLIFKYRTGASISSPLIVGNKIIAAGYGGLYLFGIGNDGIFKLLDKHGGTYESTPFVYNRRIYIASRNGYFYCLGN